jgi:hypothetical protein
MRPELKPLPERMRHLRIDDRGWPVPWFVPWVNGQPEFRAMHAEKRIKAIKDGRCWVCGGSLYRLEKAFVIGPMCGINRTTAEPPCHLECARWSAENCPFLTQREIRRREDEFTKSCAFPGIGLKRNPGVVLVWMCCEFKIFSDEKGDFLLNIGPPCGLEFFSHGRNATWPEIIESVESGFPLLAEMAKDDPASMAELLNLKDKFLTLAREQGVYAREPITT